MATSAIYRLLPMGERSTTVDGLWFPTGGRTKWAISISTGRVLAPITVVIETSPDGASGSETVAKTEVVSAAEVKSVDVTVGAHQRRIRARVTAATDKYSTEVRASSPFFDPRGESQDLALVSKEISTYVEGKVRLFEEAEDDVLDLFDRDESGRLDADMDRPDFADQVKGAIARQVEHLYRLQRLGESKDPSSIITLRNLGPYPEGLTRKIGRLKASGALPIWYGR